jgi:hypothetical protein
MGEGERNPLALLKQKEFKMSVRERRSLWGSISTSRKVNRLSLKAALLYTWAIPHFDDEGFQEGDPQTLKARIVPLRDEIPVSEIAALVSERKALWEKRKRWGINRHAEHQKQ